MSEESPADRPRIDGRSAAINGRSTPNYRSVITRSPAGRLDGRSAAGKRVRDLYRALMTRLNEPADIVVQADVMAVSELKTAAEIARANLLEGKDQSSNECVRLENLVRRAEARVGLVPAASSEETTSNPFAMLLDLEEETAE